MIVVKIELWPKGIEKFKKDLGIMHIVNIGEDLEVGEYKVTIFNAGHLNRGYTSTNKRGYIGKDAGFKRQLESPWKLLQLACEAINV